MALTADRIVTLACQIAKCPGFTTQAQDFLNLVLEDLAQNYDFPSAAYTFNAFSIGPSSGTGTGTPTGQWYNLALPASAVLVQNNATYLRTHSVSYSVSGSIFYLNQLPLDKYDQLFQGQGISNYPYWYAVDTEGSGSSQAIPQMSFYPPTQQSLSLTIRTQYLPPDIATPSSSSSIPWFPNQKYLYTELAADLMGLTGDSRQSQFRTDATAMLTAYLKMVGDKQNFATTVKKDPNVFRTTGWLRPTKTTGF